MPDVNLLAVLAATIVAFVLSSWKGGLLLCLFLWIGFPLVLWRGACARSRVTR